MALCGKGGDNGEGCGPGFTEAQGECICLKECTPPDILTPECGCKSCEGNLVRTGSIILYCPPNIFNTNTVRVLGTGSDFGATLNGRACVLKSYKINDTPQPIADDILPCSLNNEYVVEMKLDCDGCEKTLTYNTEVGLNSQCCPEGKSYRCDSGIGCTEINGLSGYPSLTACQADPGCDPCKLKYTDLELGLYNLTCQECVTEEFKAKLQYTYDDTIECCQLGTVRTIGSVCDLPPDEKGVYNESCNCVSSDMSGYKWACIPSENEGSNSKCLPSPIGSYEDEPECCDANPMCCVDGSGNPTALNCHKYTLTSNTTQVTATVTYTDCNGSTKTISTSPQQSGASIFCAKEVTSRSATAVVSSFPTQSCSDSDNDPPPVSSVCNRYTVSHRILNQYNPLSGIVDYTECDGTIRQGVILSGGRAFTLCARSVILKNNYATYIRGAACSG